MNGILQILNRYIEKLTAQLNDADKTSIPNLDLESDTQVNSSQILTSLYQNEMLQNINSCLLIIVFFYFRD